MFDLTAADVICLIQALKCYRKEIEETDPDPDTAKVDILHVDELLERLGE